MHNLHHRLNPKDYLNDVAKIMETYLMRKVVEKGVATPEEAQGKLFTFRGTNVPNVARVICSTNLQSKAGQLKHACNGKQQCVTQHNNIHTTHYTITYIHILARSTWRTGCAPRSWSAALGRGTPWGAFASPTLSTLCSSRTSWTNGTSLQLKT